MSSDEICGIAHDLIQDALCFIERGQAVPTDKQVEETVDGYCKQHKWHTPARYSLYQEIVNQLNIRMDNDKSIDIRECASNIFNVIMNDVESVQYDGIENNVFVFLDEHEFTRRHYDAVYKQVCEYIRKTIAETSIYPIGDEDKFEIKLHNTE